MCASKILNFVNWSQQDIGLHIHIESTSCLLMCLPTTSFAYHSSIICYIIMTQSQLYFERKRRRNNDRKSIIFPEEIFHSSNSKKTNSLKRKLSYCTCVHVVSTVIKSFIQFGYTESLHQTVQSEADFESFSLSTTFHRPFSFTYPFEQIQTIPKIYFVTELTVYR